MMRSNTFSLRVLLNRFVLVCMTFFSVSMSVWPARAFALSEAQMKLYGKQIYYYDIDACGNLSKATDSTNVEANFSSSSLYMVGDSITDGGKEKLEAEYKNAGIDSVYINGSSSRSITGRGETTGLKTSGLEAIKGDAKRIDKADTVVIALGTNQNNDFEDSVKKLIGEVKKADTDDSGLKIYWVNIFSRGGSDGYGKIDRNKINGTLSKLANSLKYTVIDTTKADIDLADSVHPTPKGYGVYAETVAEGLKTDKKVEDSPATTCECGGAGNPDAKLTGSDNVAKALNFFIDQGYTAEQSAGIIGNFIEESGVDPTIVEGGGHSKTVPPPVGPQGQPGYGIAQWTSPNRKTALKAYADKENQEVYRLGLQLKFVVKEMKESYPSLEGDLKKIKSGDMVKESAFLFHKVYEGSADGIEGITERSDSGKDALVQHGSGGGSGASSDETSCSSGEQGEIDGEYSLPVPKKWYKSNPEYFKKPHHDDPNNPAVDIPVPRGTPVFAVVGGKITKAPNEGGYGRGVTIEGSDGLLYEYGHGIDGGSVKGAKQGDTVQPGQLLMHVNDTGSSHGDHLHLSIRVKGEEVCPQKFLISIAEGKPIDPSKLPSKGCTPV